nr:PREDICTED: transcription factor HES-3-like [Lepisosteus oculatus]
MQSRLETPAKLPPHDRTISKLLMEKKRRARINSCLEQLKTLLETQYPKISKHKLEKADILEMTVTHLKKMQESNQDFSGNEMTAQLHLSGFKGCVERAGRFVINQPDGKGLALHLLSGLSRPPAPQRPGFTFDSAIKKKTHSETPTNDSPRTALYTSGNMNSILSVPKVLYPPREPSVNVAPGGRKPINQTDVDFSKSTQGANIHIYSPNSKSRTCASGPAHWRPW